MGTRLPSGGGACLCFGRMRCRFRCIAGEKRWHSHRVARRVHFWLRSGETWGVGRGVARRAPDCRRPLKVSRCGILPSKPPASGQTSSPGQGDETAHLLRGSPGVSPREGVWSERMAVRSIGRTAMAGMGEAPMPDERFDEDPAAHSPMEGWRAVCGVLRSQALSRRDVGESRRTPASDAR